MKMLLVLVIACGAIAAAQARPLVVQESARITNPDPTGFPYFAADVAVDGDDAIATTRNTRWRSTSSTAPAIHGRP